MLDAARKERELRLRRRVHQEKIVDEQQERRGIQGVGEMVRLVERSSWAAPEGEEKVQALLQDFKVHAVRLEARPKVRFVPEPPLLGGRGNWRRTYVLDESGHVMGEDAEELSSWTRTSDSPPSRQEPSA